MRYRSLGASGLSVSVVTLGLPAALGQREAYRLVCASLELGINSFEIGDRDTSAAAAIGEVLGSVERKLLVLTLRMTDAPLAEAPMRVQEAVTASRADRFDMVLLSPPEALGSLQPMAQHLRRDRLARLVGALGDSQALDRVIAQDGLDAIAVPYNLRSDWPDRNRIKAAVGHSLGVLGRDFHIDARAAAQAQGPKGLARLFQRGAVREAQDAYAFLRETPGWTSEQICLTYALAEPALATVQVETASAILLQQLCEASERQLPAGVAAQIEIARFAALPQSGAA